MRFEVLPSLDQLAGAMDLRMAGQDLLDQRGPRAGQAEDEDRPPRVASPPPGSRSKNAGWKAPIILLTNRSCSAGS